MSTALATYESTAVIQQERMELSVEQIVAKVAKVRDVAAKVMKEDIHFGTIPGTPKPTLYKAGGEILALTFRLAPKYEEQRIDLGHGHLEYKVTCNLYHIHTGEFYGSGLGSCSTMENKYRYRPGPVTPTGRPVPKEYWNLRASDPTKAKEMLGGHGFSTKKIDGQWEIVEQGETIENPNPADQYNTVLKMAGKRAYVDAILKATAASEVYTQDLEDMAENQEVTAKTTQKPSQDVPQSTNSAQPVSGDGPKCPICRAPMKLKPAGTKKDGKSYPAFYSCSKYPACKGTMKESEYQAQQQAEPEPPIEGGEQGDPVWIGPDVDSGPMPF